MARVRTFISIDPGKAIRDRLVALSGPNLAHEIAERHILWHAAAGRVQHPNGCGVSRGFGREFDPPHALATVASVLFDDPRTRQLQPPRKFLMKCFGGAIQMGVRAPAKVSGAVKHLFRAHLEDHIRMRTDPNTVSGDVT